MRRRRRRRVAGKFMGIFYVSGWGWDVTDEHPWLSGIETTTDFRGSIRIGNTYLAKAASSRGTKEEKSGQIAPIAPTTTIFSQKPLGSSARDTIP